MKTKTNTLIIIFNTFRPQDKIKYLEIIEKDGEVIGEKQLARKPRAARFDEVMENPCGSHNAWNAHKARRIFKHKLEKS